MHIVRFQQSPTYLYVNDKNAPNISNLHNIQTFGVYFSEVQIEKKNWQKSNIVLLMLRRSTSFSTMTSNYLEESQSVENVNQDKNEE